MNFFSALFIDYTIRTVALGCLVLGLVSGVLGSFAVLRKQGLLGDALSHSALPGICAAFMITGQKSPLILMLGAAIAAWVAMRLISAAIRSGKLDSGSALASTLTSFFGLGIVLLTVIQKSNNASQAGLDKFLFGQAAGLVQDQVVTMAVAGAIVLAGVLLLYPSLKLATFDPLLAEVSGFPVRRLDMILSLCLIVAIVLGLNTVGVVLMSAMLVAPAAAARQWTNRLEPMIAISAVSGVVCGVVGALLSSFESQIPTGPVIVLCLSVWVFASVLFGSAKGIAWRRLRRRQFREQSA